MTVLLSCISFASASEVEIKEVQQSKTDYQSTFKYPLTPVSKEWKNYSSLQLKEMLNVPLDVIEKMDTETLLAAVLDYPFMADIYAFDSTKQGIEALAMEFNGAAGLYSHPQNGCPDSIVIIKTFWRKNRRDDY